MIKLKDLIQESLEPLQLSKKEEAEAVNFIKLKVIPDVATTFNNVYPINYLIGKDGKWTKSDTGLRIKPEDISQVLKKTSEWWGHEHDKNIQVITYSAHVQLTQRIKGHQKFHDFDFYIFKHRKTNKIIIEVNYHLSSYGNRNYIMGIKGEQPLTESIKSSSTLKISKKEEAEALNHIRKVLVLKVVDFWNKTYDKDLDPNIIAKSLKKTAEHSMVYHGYKTDIKVYTTEDLLSYQHVEFQIYKAVNMDNHPYIEIKVYMPDHSAFHYIMK